MEYYLSISPGFSEGDIPTPGRRLGRFKSYEDAIGFAERHDKRIDAIAKKHSKRYGLRFAVVEGGMIGHPFGLVDFEKRVYP